MNKFYSANYAELDELYDNKSIEAFANNKEGYSKVKERNRKEIMGQLDIKYNDNRTTHFNKDDNNENHINHKTIFNHGEVSFVDKNNGVNIHQKKTKHNPTGMGTHFNYEGSGKHYIRGHTNFRGHVNLHGGRIHVKDKENKGRVRIGAVWGIPGLYSEDNQDLVLGVSNERKVKLGTKGKLIEVDADGNLRLPEGAKIFVGNKEIGRHSRHTENAKKQKINVNDGSFNLTGLKQTSDSDILG